MTNKWGGAAQTARPVAPESQAPAQLATLPVRVAMRPRRRPTLRRPDRKESRMSAPPTRGPRASLATALAWAAVVLVLAAVFASGAGSNGAAATAAVALLLVALVGEVVHYRNHRGGPHG